MSRLVCLAAAAFASVLAFPAGLAFAQNATTPGAITTPYPTSQGIAIEWAITGDANLNGVVTVRYRANGATAWKNGMALRRISAGSNTSGTFGSGNGQWGNKHAGSLFDLDPGMLYDIELTLTDPDGGSMTAMTSAGTRVIPSQSANAPVKAVTPSTLTSVLNGAMPGDVLMLGAGSYPTFTVSKNGNPGQPIVIRGESVDNVIIGGRVTMSDRHDVNLENVTVMGEVRMNGASNMVVRGCRIRTTAGGITFQMGNAVPRNNTIVDNDIVGGATWVDNQLSADGYDGGEGIQFTGSGHVICFNHVALFRDDISLMEYTEAFEQTSIDICNNDIEQATDDAIESDSAMGNVRIFRNRITNCFDGISAQPDLGGPTYYVRNAMYNVLYTAFKFHNGTVGDVVLHNTAVKCGDALGVYAGATWSRAYFRNNVLIGGMGGGTYGGYSNGTGRIFDMPDADTTCSFDYDGLASIGTNMFQGRIGAATFNSFATLTANTTEKNAVMVDLGIFASPPAFPASPFPPKSIADLRLAAGSAAVDKGTVIVGIDDDFAGAAPDLGAYELGAPLPTYGPRAGNPGTGGSTGSGGAAGSGSGGASGNSGSGTGGSAGGGTGGSTGAGTGGSMSGGVAGSSASGAGGGAGSGSGSAGTTGQTGGGSGGCSCATAEAAGFGQTWLVFMFAAVGAAFRRRRL
jgi:MYXO-CTERM domain-containing protein